MTCNRCGREITENQEYCKNCGNYLLDVNKNNNNRNIEYQPNHYLKILIIYYAIIYVGVIIPQFILMWLYPLIFGMPLYSGDNLTTHATNFINIWMQIIIYVSLFIITVVMLWKSIKNDLIKFTKLAKYTIKLAFIGIAALYISMYVIQLTYNSLNITGSSGNQSAIEEMMFSSGTLPLVLYCIVLIILAPIVEELIFRKSIFSYLKKFNLSKNKKIIISALLFGFLHIFSTVITLLSEGAISEIFTEFILSIPYIAMGFITSYTYAESDENVICPLIIHIFNNAVSCISILALYFS